ncbi:MAG: sugar ABC transporter permease [Clostridia bacterium]|nr:sugar ABC transporter permease [Clostridia bacterium]
MEKEKRKTKIGVGKERFFIIVMLLIPISNFLVFWVYTSFDTILMAFQKWDVAQGKDVFSMQNFEMLYNELKLADSTLFVSLKNTLLFFASNVCIILPVSFLLCYFLYKQIAGYKIYRFVFYLPSIVTSSVYVVLFKQILTPSGFIGKLSEALTGEVIPFLTDSRYALNTILIYSILTSFGGNLIYFSGAMSNIDTEIIEAAKIDGAGMGTEMFRIVIPLIWPTLSTILLFTFVGIFGSSGPILLFTQGEYKTSTFAYWMYDLIYFSSNYYYAAAIGVSITVVAAPIAILLRKFLIRSYVED